MHQQLPSNHWFPILTSRELGKRPLGVERLGIRLVLWRDEQQAVHAQDDRCPHLGATLSSGHVEDGCLVCPFHGLRFAGNGQCAHIPALGRDARIPAGLAVRSHLVCERHGFIWLWWGDQVPHSLEPAFFPELETGWSHHTVAVDWPVHYTRAIESQLDVAHLAFVHRTTIGAGGASFVEGPHVEADGTDIRVWTTNRRDDGTPPRTAAQLAAAAADRPPSLHFRLPGIWLLNISPRLRNFIAFVPVNAHCTRYYLRSYLRLRNPLLAAPWHRLLALGNRFILDQDRRVAVTQPAGSSLDNHDEHLLRSDQAIIEFRRMLARRLLRKSSESPAAQ